MKLSEEDKTIFAIVHDKPTLTQKEYALELGWTVDSVRSTFKTHAKGHFAKKY